jgi:hypothetical protein
MGRGPIHRWEGVVVRRSSGRKVGPRLEVWVLGTPDRVLVDALWAIGLRPVRGGISGCLWARPREVKA